MPLYKEGNHLGKLYVVIKKDDFNTTTNLSLSLILKHHIGTPLKRCTKMLGTQNLYEKINI